MPLRSNKPTSKSHQDGHKPTSRSHQDGRHKHTTSQPKDPLKGSEKVDGDLTRMSPPRAKRPSKSVEDEMRRANRAGSNYDPTDVSDSYDATLAQSFANRVFESAWQRKEGKNKEGGLNEKGRKAYERENPGSDLKAPVSAAQAKKSKGGKAAKRRKSFCARMSGMPGPMKDEKGRPTRKALSLRKWDC